MTCKTVKHKKKRVCTGKLVSGPVKFTVAGVRATISRGHVVIATGIAVATRSGPWRLELERRALATTRPLHADHGRADGIRRYAITIV